MSGPTLLPLAAEDDAAVPASVAVRSLKSFDAEACLCTGDGEGLADCGDLGNMTVGCLLVVKNFAEVSPMGWRFREMVRHEENRIQPKR